MDLLPQREHSPQEFWLAHVKAWRASCMRAAESPVNWFTGVVQSPEQIEVTSDGIR